MQLQKAFYLDGDNLIKNRNERVFVFIGIIGAAIISYGLTQYPPQIYYVLGSSLLLITAIYFQLTYFVALETILLAGHGAILLGIGPILQIAIPSLLTAQLLFYYIFSGQLKSIYLFIGIIGIALLSSGFAYANPWIFFFGSLCVALFSFYSFQFDKRVVLIWALLNCVFVISTATTLF